MRRTTWRTQRRSRRTKARTGWPACLCVPLREMVFMPCSSTVRAPLSLLIFGYVSFASCTFRESARAGGKAFLVRFAEPFGHIITQLIVIMTIRFAWQAASPLRFSKDSGRTPCASPRWRPPRWRFRPPREAPSPGSVLRTARRHGSRRRRWCRWRGPGIPATSSASAPVGQPCAAFADADDQRGVQSPCHPAQSACGTFPGASRQSQPSGDEDRLPFVARPDRTVFDHFAERLVVMSPHRRRGRTARGNGNSAPSGA